MENKVLQTIKKYNMINPSDCVIIGVSGGADSVCLLSILNKLKEDLEFNIYGIHLHHGIRGEDANRDAQYVEDLCRKLNIPCEVIFRDIPKEAMAQKISVEEAGRNARYSLFKERANRFKNGKIAIAHHKNDQAETILHNIIRGSGLKGLGGMKPVRDNIIRPLFECSREEIENYCFNNKIEYKQDYTNAIDTYTRNKIRLNLIPDISKNYNPNIVNGLFQMGELLREDEAYMTMQVEQAYKDSRIQSKEGTIELSVEALLLMHRAIRKRVYRRAFVDMGASLKDIENKHINRVDELIYYTTGKQIHLPGNMIASRNYQTIELGRTRELLKGYEYNIASDSFEGYIKECSTYVEISTFGKTRDNDFPKKIYTKWFDYDKIKCNLAIRTRKTGDYIMLKGIHEGQKGKKKIKDYFIDNKIPRDIRDEVPLVADGNNIMWVVGYRMSEDYKVSPATTKILEIKFIKGVTQ
jgi:tRNA(Ile)-lysidine synthase